MRNLIVEITSKEGVRIERLVLGERGLSIGRAWNSDLIVQDRFVDPDHLFLAIDQDDQIVIADQNTTNGSRLGGKHLSNVAKHYRFGEVLTIGDSRVKIFDAQMTVEPTSLRSKWFLLAERFSSYKALLSLTVLAMLVEVIQSYNRSTELLKVESLVVKAFGVLMLILIWSALLGFISKLLRGDSNLKPLWVLGCLSVIVANVLMFALLVVRFNLQDLSLGDDISLVVLGAASVLLLVGILSYITHLQNSRKWLYALLVVVSIYGISGSNEYLKEPHQLWSSSTKTEQATLPSTFLLRQGRSLDEYQSAVDSLYEQE